MPFECRAQVHRFGASHGGSSLIGVKYRKCSHRHNFMHVKKFEVARSYPSPLPRAACNRYVFLPGKSTRSGVSSELAANLDVDHTVNKVSRQKIKRRMQVQNIHSPVVPQKKSSGTKCALHTIMVFVTGFPIRSFTAHSFFSQSSQGNECRLTSPLTARCVHCGTQHILLLLYYLLILRKQYVKRMPLRLAVPV